MHDNQAKISQKLKYPDIYSLAENKAQQIIICKRKKSLWVWGLIILTLILILASIYFFHSLESYGSSMTSLTTLGIHP
jgi:hypothetical protein